MTGLDKGVFDVGMIQVPGKLQLHYPYWVQEVILMLCGPKISHLQLPLSVL